MISAKPIAATALRQVRNARMNNPSSHRLYALDTCRESSSSSKPKKISPLAREMNQRQKRQLSSASTNQQGLQGRLTIEEVRAALEPITIARERAARLQGTSIPLP